MERHNILVIGSANADLVIYTDKMPKLGQTVIGKDFAVNAGGKGLNQSIALAKAGIDDVTVDIRSEKLGYKLREAQLEKIPYMLVIGDKEAEEGTVSVRKRGQGDIGSMTIADFASLAVQEMQDKIYKNTGFMRASDL